MPPAPPSDGGLHFLQVPQPRPPASWARQLPRYPGPNRQFFWPAAACQVEVLDDTTLLLRLEPKEQPQGEAEEDSLLLGLFLDFLSRQALTSDSDPVLYTEAMAADETLGA